MEGLQVFLMVFLVVGFAAGAGAVWLVLQGRTSAAYDRARSEVQSTLTELSEQVQGKQEQAQALQAALDQGVSAMSTLKAEAEEVTARQTAAESENAALAGSLQERDQRLAALESELAGARAEVASQADHVAPPPPPPAAPASDSSVLQVLARPIEEHLAELRVRLEQLSAAPSPEPVLSEDILRNLARPIEEKISELRQRLEEIGAARPESALSEEVFQGLARPIGEQLADMRLRLEQLGAAPATPPVTAEILQNLARPIEDQLHGMDRRLERMETDQARSSAASAGLHARNAQLNERLHNVTSGLCELRGALARSLDLCSLTLATAGTVVEAPAVEAEAVLAPEPQPVVVAEFSEPAGPLAVTA